MSVLHLVATAGLLGLAGGMLLVNIVSTPRAAQTGVILASCGVVLLAALAIRQLLF
jgi:energy-converting hydrogenase Eha subunit B